MPHMKGREKVLSFWKMLMFLLTDRGTEYIQKLSRRGEALCNTCVILAPGRTVRRDRWEKYQIRGRERFARAFPWDESRREWKWRCCDSAILSSPWRGSEKPLFRCRDRLPVCPRLCGENEIQCAADRHRRHRGIEPTRDQP